LAVGIDHYCRVSAAIWESWMEAKTSVMNGERSQQLNN